MIAIGGSAGHALPVDEARSAGKSPREVTVGIYIQRALWEVTIKKYYKKIKLSPTSHEGDGANCEFSQGHCSVEVFEGAAEQGIQSGQPKPEESRQWWVQGEVQRDNTTTGELRREDQENLCGPTGREQDKEVRPLKHFQSHFHLPGGR